MALDEERSEVIIIAIAVITGITAGIIAMTVIASIIPPCSLLNYYDAGMLTIGLGPHAYFGSSKEQSAIVRVVTVQWWYCYLTILII